ncbi:2-C-methyl-D-erythritol 4-phosphate cytidylyltransferase, partial [Klebsiella pneumoniae]|uniref:IspD/TarI family cytidylyltransferase n=1 Tax=Klebsiella pneumoniae TaxID=573 RepID=UPI0027316BD1
SLADSVLGGLAELRARGALDDDWVLVHDAARCLLQPGWVDALIDACQHDPVGGLLAQPVADTLKAGDADGRVSATLDRRDKW